MLTFAASFTGDDHIFLKRCFTYFCYKWKLLIFLVISFQSLFLQSVVFADPRRLSGPAAMSPLGSLVAIEISREDRNFGRS